MTVAILNSPTHPNDQSFAGNVSVGGNVAVVGYVNATTLKINGTTVGAALAGAAAPVDIPLNQARVIAAWKDTIADSPGSNILGLTDTEASVLLGNAASGNTKNDNALFVVSLPAWYVAGSAISVRLTAKCDPAATVSSTVDCVSLKVNALGVLGSDLCTTAAQAINDTYAAKSFTITPTSRVAGETLHILVGTQVVDTGGTTNATGSIAKVELLLG